MNDLSLCKKRILIVDDTGIVRLVHRKILVESGYVVDEASNGREALEMLENGYDVIFMDINMPIMNGLITTAEIRRREAQGRHTPIVGITGYDTEKEVCLNAGMDDVAFKPITPEKIQQLAERWSNNNG